MDTTPRTSPYLAAAVGLAVLLIVGFHYAGFHFVVAGGAGR